MLDAAGRAFAERGFHAVSMDEIAAAAGISKPMLYNYFGSKERLYIAYVEQAGRTLLDDMRKAADPAAPVQARLSAGILAFLTYVDEHRAGWALLYQEATNQGGPLAAEVAALRERIARMLYPLFDDWPGSDEGLDETACEALASAFVGAGESIANWWLHHPGEPKERVAALLLSFAGAAAR
jgi:AcrR family transcriptional regulator